MSERPTNCSPLNDGARTTVQTRSQRLNVLTVDSRYPTPAFLSGLREYPNLLVITRVRSNRLFYRQPEAGRYKTRPTGMGTTFACTML